MGRSIIAFDPEVLAAGVVENIEAGLESFRSILDTLEEDDGV